MATDPDTPVIVVHYRAPEWCSSAIRAISASEDIKTRITVVDNSGELAAISSTTTGDVVAPDTNAGYAGGANLGIRRALARHPRATHVVVCSHDFHPETDCLRRLAAALEGDPAAGIVAPLLSGPVPSVGWSWNGTHAQNLQPGDDLAAVVEVDWVSGTCMMIRSRCLREIGGFDEGFGSYVEDVDLCLRARDAGWKVLTVTTARGRGIGSVSTARTRLALVNTVLLVAKRDGSRPAYRLLATFGWRAARTFVGGCLPRRQSRASARSSRRYAIRRASGVLELVVRHQRIRAYATDPHRHEAPVELQ